MIENTLGEQPGETSRSIGSLYRETSKKVIKII